MDKTITILNDDTNDITSKQNNLCVEITYYSDSLPSIKSYYLMSSIEYEDLKTQHMDIFIENFMNDEDLTKDKLDIHIVHNVNSIKIFKDFVNTFGNPFDILTTINAKKHMSSKKNDKISSSDILDTNFSDKESLDESDEDSVKHFKYGKLQLFERAQADSDIDSDEYITTMTEIIDTFNKTKKVDKEKMNKLIKENPKIGDDAIISEIKAI
jgi:hypothetical protein